MTRRRSFLAAVVSSTTVLTFSGCLGDVVSDDSEEPENDGENEPDEADKAEDIAVSAGATTSQTDEGQVTVTFTSSGNADHLLIQGDCAFSNETLADPGDSATQACSAGDTISVVAVHESGAETVVQTYTVS